MNELQFEYLWQRRDTVLYKARLSALYHSKRERFLDLSDKFGKVVAILGSSAALWKIANPDVLAWLLVPVAVWSSISLVFSLADRARRHAELGRQWRVMIARIEEHGERDFTEADIGQWMGEAMMIESSEPPILGALVAKCQNDIAIADGQPDSVRRLGFWRWSLMHFLDVPPTPAG